ncbi:MAG: hypothetical protein HZA93_25725 [Verrucomicrobia bacterium]|nr:hypothetical protein [Verrucomicrobiota bacterium]
MNPDRIILVYNADNGLFNAVTGWSHKLLSPETYQCSLCRITFGLSGMLISWKNFLQMLPFPAIFFHRDEFLLRYPQYQAINLPLILAEKDCSTEILLHADQIGNSGGVASLIGLIQLKLEQWAHAQAAKAPAVSPAARRH